MIADMFTKNLNKFLFEKHRDKIMEKGAEIVEEKNYRANLGGCGKAMKGSGGTCSGQIQCSSGDTCSEQSSRGGRCTAASEQSASGGETGAGFLNSN